MGSCRIDPIEPQRGEVMPGTCGTSGARMRDLEVINSELRLLVAIRRMVREVEGRTPNARRIDQLLDERAAAEHQGPVTTGGAYGDSRPLVMP